MENRFNNLSSKEWLPFQKSWFYHTNLEKTFIENLKFFTKASKNCPKRIFFYSSEKKNLKIVKDLCNDNFLELSEKINTNFDFALIDTLSLKKSKKTLEEEEKKILEISNRIFERINDRKFLCVLARNYIIKNNYITFAWDIAKNLSKIFSLKDEKIGCEDKSVVKESLSDQSFFYSLYFRKDENSKNKKIITSPDKTKKTIVVNWYKSSNKAWQIIKPRPRKKNEILHPAKYPEEIVEFFLKIFTKQDDNVLDPMCGTGSTIISCLENKRNGYGIELNDSFSKIANDRCFEFYNPNQPLLFKETKEKKNYFIKNIDARKIKSSDFPKINYIITSPPYWDMLNEKGFENQQKRRNMNLKLNYSESKDDFGNIENYDQFIEELSQFYVNLSSLLSRNGILTVIVKNIKKKGKNYPLAWDLSKKLECCYNVIPEFFWLQDDINIAPYGYGNTFVSNTFHHYCLNFQKR